MEALEDRRVPALFTVTNLDNAGPGSLRQAIHDANQLPEASTIEFQWGMAGTIALQTELENLASNITISAPYPSITVTEAEGVSLADGFFIDPGTTCEIDDLTIERIAGDAIANHGTLTLRGCMIHYCGGRILNNTDESLDMYSCTVEGNGLTGVGMDGGGIANMAGTLNCTYCWINFNEADNGGGIYTESPGGVTLTNCSLSFNHAAQKGGGIFSDNSTVVMIGENGPRHQAMSADLANNDAVEAGGGLYQDGSGARTTFTGVSIITNQVTGPGGMGGGVCIDAGSVYFDYYCYVDSNSATLGTSIAYRSPWGSFGYDDTCWISPTIEYYF